MSSHPGNSHIDILDRLLYLYTEPYDIVMDPFAGGGSTIDICKKRLRRYFVSDRAPIVEREAEIRKLDVTKTLPGPARWSDVKLVYLDPPYWKQMEGKYSDDPTDLANMDLDSFHATLARLIRGSADSGASRSAFRDGVEDRPPSRRSVCGSDERRDTAAGKLGRRWSSCWPARPSVTGGA